MGPFGFTGELHHGDQVYLRARWYAPGSGTFPTRDPFAGWAETPYSLHAYQYAYAAPTVWTDPSGEVIPRCPIGYHPMMRADGSFGGCERTGQVPPWVSDVSLGLPIPGTAGHLGGRTLGHLGREGLEACTNLIGGTLVWMLTQTSVETQTRTPKNSIIVFHYTSLTSAQAIATSGVYNAQTDGLMGYGMYVTTYDHQSGYSDYRLSYQELQFGLRGLPRWRDQSVEGYVKLLIPVRLLQQSRLTKTFYPMARRGGSYPDVSGDEQKTYNAMRKNVLIYALLTSGKGSNPGSIDIHQYVVDWGPTQFR